jgi:trehalose-phosphatase
MRRNCRQGQCMQHLFDCWDEITHRVNKAERIRLYLDFDGTLVTFRPKPEQVKLREKTRIALKKLVRHQDLTVAILSGRRRAVLVNHINVPGIQYLGLYGSENGNKVSISSETSAGISKVRGALAGLPAEIPGISLENKGISLAVHFRGATPNETRRAHLQVRRATKRFHADLHIVRSDTVWDVVPASVHGKGVALRKSMETAEKPFLGIYVGDDGNDEPAFKALRGGITVRVGTVPKTNARYWLRDPTEVWMFLKRLEVELP